jgi:hypothetical protein
MTTGSICPVAGLYRSTCADHVLLRIKKGDKKPPCPRCHKPTVWEWVRRDIEEKKPKRGNGD